MLSTSKSFRLSFSFVSHHVYQDMAFECAALWSCRGAKASVEASAEVLIKF